MPFPIGVQKGDAIMGEEKVFLLHDEELENKVLGSLVLLCREGHFDTFLNARLSESLFYSRPNKAIFKAMADLVYQGTIPDEVTIFSRLQKGDIANAPAPDELVERLSWNPGQEVNFVEHISILRDLALRREAQAVAQRLSLGCANPTVDICDLIQGFDSLKAEVDTMVSGTFSAYEKGADKARIRELLIKRGESLSTGYHFGSEELCIAPKALTFVVASTGHCKSTFLANLALRVCAAHPKKKVLFLSYEEALESVYVNMLNIYAKVILGDNNRNIIANHTMASGDPEKLLKVSKAEYDDYRHFLMNRQAVVEFEAQERAFYKLIEDGRLNIQYVDFTADKLISFIKEMRRNGMCDIVFIDYVQLLNAPVRSKYRSREDELKEICVSLKDLAVDEDCGLPIVFGAQFNRQVRSAKDLLTTNIGEAGDIERIANTIVALWNCQKTEDPGTPEARQKIAEYQGTKEYNSSAIFAKVLKRRGYASGFTATFPFEGNTGRILDRGDATTEEINCCVRQDSLL